MIIILDDVFSEDVRNDIYSKYSNNKSPKSLDWFSVGEVDIDLAKLLFIGNQYIDLSAYVGVEVWTQYNSKPNYHYDKDEILFNRTSELKFPICTILYYPYISETLIGGEFITADIKIKPKTNRAIIFSAGLYHSVNEYVGERFSLVVNPWSYKPEGY